MISFKKLQEFKVTDSGKNLMMSGNEIIFIKFEAYGSCKFLNRSHCEGRRKNNKKGRGGRHESEKLAHGTMLTREKMTGRRKERMSGRH